MSVLYTLVITLFFSFSLFAKDLKIGDIKYQLTHAPQIKKQAAIKALSKKLSTTLKLKPIEKSNKGNLKLFNVDQILHNYTYKKNIYISLSFKPQKDFLDKVLNLDYNSKLFHFPKDGLYVSLLFENFKEEEINLAIKIVKAIKITYSKKQNTLLNMIFPKANASVTTKACGELPFVKSLFNATKTGSIISTCFSQGLSAAGQRADHLNELLSSPVKMWSSVKETFHGVVNFFSDFSNNVKKVASDLGDFIDELNGMDPLLICNLVGSLLPDIALGAATGVLIARVVSKLRLFQKLKGALVAIGNIRKNNPEFYKFNKNQIALFYQKLLAGKISKATAATMGAVGWVSGKLALEVAVCAIKKEA